MTKGRNALFGLALAALAGLSLLILIGDNGWFELTRKRDEQRRLADANRQLLQENQQLYRRVDRLRNDLHYIEEVARQELGMVRAEDMIFTFTTDKTDKTDKAGKVGKKDRLK